MNITSKCIFINKNNYFKQGKILQILKTSKFNLKCLRKRLNTKKIILVDNHYSSLIKSEM